MRIIRVELEIINFSRTVFYIKSSITGNIVAVTAPVRQPIIEYNSGFTVLFATLCNIENPS